MRSAVLWDFMQHKIVVYWLRFGRTYRSLEDGTDTLSRDVGKKLPFYAALNPKRAQIVNECAYQWNCDAWVKSAFGFVKQNWIPRVSFIQNCHSFLFGFSSLCYFTRRYWIPGCLESWAENYKNERSIYVWDFRCSLECCWRFGQVFWHVTRCLIFSDVSKDSAFEIPLCWLYLMNRIPTPFILRDGEGLKDERLQSWSEGTPEFRNNCHRDVMSSVPGPCGLDVQQATTREGR